MQRTDDKYKPIEVFKEEKVVYLFSKDRKVNELFCMEALSAMDG